MSHAVSAVQARWRTSALLRRTTDQRRRTRAPIGRRCHAAPLSAANGSGGARGSTAALQSVPLSAVRCPQALSATDLMRKKLAASAAAAARQATEVASEQELAALHITQQGNAAFYTEEAIAARLTLLHNPGVAAAIDAWWGALPKEPPPPAGDGGAPRRPGDAGEGEEADAAIGKGTFCAMIVGVSSALDPDGFDPAEAATVADEEWAEDADGADQARGSPAAADQAAGSPAVWGAAAYVVP